MSTTVRQQPLIAMLSPARAAAAIPESRMMSRTPGGSEMTSTTSVRLWTRPVNMNRWVRVCLTEVGVRHSLTYKMLEEGLFLRAAVPGEVPEIFHGWPADERYAEERDRIVPDDED